MLIIKQLFDCASLQRIGNDEDPKGAALLFAPGIGKHVSGQILAVDGGVSGGC